MFSIGEYLGVSDATATIIIAFVIGAVGVIYLFIGGLSLAHLVIQSMVSD